MTSRVRAENGPLLDVVSATFHWTTTAENARYASGMGDFYVILLRDTRVTFFFFLLPLAGKK